MTTSALYVPGRPVTGPGDKCPLCLNNGMFKGVIVAETQHGFGGQIAEDLLLICPKAHVTGEPWGTAFATEYFGLLELSLTALSWEAYNESRNIGHLAGQRLEHIHYKLQRRVAGHPGDGWGLDGLLNLVKNPA